MACCKSCARVAGKGKRKKSRSAGVGQIFKTMKGGSSRSKLLIQAAKIGGGIAAGQLVKKLAQKVMGDSAKDNSYLTGGAQILGGIVLAGLSKNTTEIGLGMAASGVSDIVTKVANIAGPGAGYGSGLGLLPYGGAGSTMLPGVSGDYSYSPSGGILAVG